MKIGKKRYIVERPKRVIPIELPKPQPQEQPIPIELPALEPARREENAHISSH
jgi:hypothetical protein